jgi:sugar lactone lactonase YvrE
MSHISMKATLLPAALATAVLALLALAPAASAKEVVDYFGTASGSGSLGGEFFRPQDIAVNSTGAGVAEAGDVYVVDSDNRRIQRFSVDDNGTPADPYDDDWVFVSAWGADVVQAGGQGDLGDATAANYEICMVASECKAGVASGGNGSTAGNGGISGGLRIALDLDTGNVYVSDSGNARVSVYSPEGAFLRSFGYDVVESGPNDNGAGYEICIAADGDVCKEGLGGANPGQVGSAGDIALSAPDGDPDTGTVFLSDFSNSRINTYELDGATPSSFGSAPDFLGQGPSRVAVDSRGIVYVAVNATAAASGGEIRRYDSEAVNGSVGFLSPIVSQTVRVTGVKPSTLTFQGPLAETDVAQISVSDGATPLSGGSGASVVTNTQGGPGVNEVQELNVSATAGQYRLTFEGQTTQDLNFNANAGEIRQALDSLASVPPAPLVDVGGASVGLEVGRDSAGPGPDTDVLYVLRVLQGGLPTIVQQFGPANEPGLSAPPSASDDTHGAAVGFTGVEGLGFDESSGRLFVSTRLEVANAPPTKHGVYVLDTAGGAPTASLDSISDVTATSATLHLTIDPNGPPPVRYDIEYSTDGATWSLQPGEVVGGHDDPQTIETQLDPFASGLLPNTEYQVRLRVTKVFNPPLVTAPLTFTTLPGPPQAETTGAPVRTASTAQLTGRVNPRGTAATYHFEYGTLGPCDSNPCSSTPTRSAGSGQLTRLAAEEITGLLPDTNYHYRLVADGIGSPVFGQTVTVTTRASDTPLGHGDFPGPPASDRAWEQVSLPDASGNPLAFVFGFSDSGHRAIYNVAGGTSQGSTGTVFGGFIFAERPPGEHPITGWQRRALEPPRSELGGAQWDAQATPDDLSALYGLNRNAAAEDMAFFRMPPGGPATVLLKPTPDDGEGTIAVSEDGSRLVLTLRGSHDPVFPSVSGTQVYDFTSGTPRLISLLPSGVPLAGCGNPIPRVDPTFELFAAAPRPARWIAPDGSRVFFGCDGNLYVRDLDAEATQLIGQGDLIKSTPGAAFFSTGESLDPADEGGSDVYRYDLDDGARECLTCLYAGLRTETGSGRTSVAVSEDGSRLYFKSPNVLLPGAAPGGVYRLRVQTGGLAYVANIGPSQVGDSLTENQAISADGSVLVFASSDPALNPLGDGADNGGTLQYYRYDDRDRSLTCVSCPADGSPPLGSVEPSFGWPSANQREFAPNVSPLAANGSTFAFVSTTPLLPVDQNTPPTGSDPFHGTDIYEWRDGRQLLVSDGISDSPLGDFSDPSVLGVSPSGRDIFFAAAARLTPDALDANIRLYTARIGGGIDFPPPPVPCPLEVCQGTPQGAPDDPRPSSLDFRGRGNPAPESPNCLAPARRARRHARAALRNSRAARRLRRAATRSSNARSTRLARRRARRMAMRAKRHAGVAKRLRTRAKRCRAANRANADQGAGG